MIAASIRFRLTVWYSAVLLLGMTLFGGFVWLAMRHQLRADLDRALAVRLTGLEEYLRVEEAENDAPLSKEMGEIARSLPPDNVVQILDPDSVVLYSTAHADDFFAQCSTQKISWVCVSRRDRYRLQQKNFSLRGRIFRMAIAAPVDDVENTLARLGVLLIAAIPGVALLAAAGGFWISGRALAPVDAMTAAAGSISIENLSARLPLPPVNDEIGRLAATWNDMLARLEIAVTRITQFTADASHELRTPIAFIRATAEVALRRSRPDAHYQDALRNIDIESQRMTELVEDLLFLARTDARASSAPGDIVDLHQPLRDAVAEIEPAADARNIRICVSNGSGSMQVLGDEPALRRMFVTVLENAVNYTPNAGQVIVELNHHSGSAVLSVSDTGVGISAEALTHIFERFYRADPSRTRQSGGYGLGLSIAQTIAAQHGGKVTAESQLGSGSVFRIHLPLK